MAKKKVVVAKPVTEKKPRAPRKKKVVAEAPSIPESVSVLPALPPAQPAEYAPPPYPLPNNPPYPVPYYPPAPVPVNPRDTMVCLDDVKSLWKSKNFWAAVCLFVLSGITLLGGIPALSSNPMFMGVTGMAFSVMWILFRMMTDQPVTPTVNLPHPSEWFKKKP